MGPFLYLYHSPDSPAFSFFFSEKCCSLVLGPRTWSIWTVTISRAETHLNVILISGNTSHRCVVPSPLRSTFSPCQYPPRSTFCQFLAYYVQLLFTNRVHRSANQHPTALSSWSRNNANPSTASAIWSLKWISMCSRFEAVAQSIANRLAPGRRGWIRRWLSRMRSKWRI